MSLYQAAGDARGGRTLARRDDDSHAVVPAASHGAASRVHHEANEKPVRRDRRPNQGEKNAIFTGGSAIKC